MRTNSRGWGAFFVTGVAATLTGCAGGGFATGPVAPGSVFANSAEPTLAGSVGTPIPLAGNAVALINGLAGSSIAAQAGVTSTRTINSAAQATLEFTIGGVTRTAPINLAAPAAGASNGVGHHGGDSRFPCRRRFSDRQLRECRP